MRAAIELAGSTSHAAACQALGICKATYYRHNQPIAVQEAPRIPRPKPPNALSPIERQAVLDQLHAENYVDLAPAEIWAALLEQEQYLCSIRTMYRILGEHHEVRERRNLARRPQYEAPELLATGPNQVWTWDITRLKGPVKFSYFQLYTILDIFSRYVVGWMVAEREHASLAERLIAATCRKQGITRDQLTIHADRGSSMTSRTVALLLSDLGVLKTHSRPHVSNDNPFSESQFKTVKYHPTFPNRFDSMQHARAFCKEFFPWYNTEHHHMGIGLLTPHVVHHGQQHEVQAQRQRVLDAAFRAHPERFLKRPTPPSIPEAVWINPPNRARATGEGVQ